MQVNSKGEIDTIGEVSLSKSVEALTPRALASMVTLSEGPQLSVTKEQYSDRIIKEHSNENSSHLKSEDRLKEGSKLRLNQMSPISSMLSSEKNITHIINFDQMNKKANIRNMTWSNNQSPQ